MVFGDLVKEELKALRDMTPREVLVFAPLVIFTLWMGIYPSSFLDFVHVSVEHLIQNHETAMNAFRLAEAAR